MLGTCSIFKSIRGVQLGLKIELDKSQTVQILLKKVIFETNLICFSLF